MKSRVHPKFKTKYRVSNWSEYDQALSQRSGLTVWMTPSAIKGWKARPSGRPGAPSKYSDLAIETALTVRLVFHLPLRQTEGFLSSLFEPLGLDLSVPDHTTLSRRSSGLTVKLKRNPSRGPVHLVIDSSGLSIVGEGEWAAAEHGGVGRRGWKKLHLGVDQAGAIIAQELTGSTGDDASTGLRLIDAVKPSIKSIAGDVAYDTLAICDAARVRGARVVVSPSRTAAISKRCPRSPARDRTVRRVKLIGGDRLRARSEAAQRTEALVACNVLNRMLGLGRPKSRVRAA